MVTRQHINSKGKECDNLTTHIRSSYGRHSCITEFIDIGLDETSISDTESQGLDEVIRGMEDEIEVTTAAASVESG